MAIDFNALARALGLPERKPLEEIDTIGGQTLLWTPNCVVCERRSEIQVPAEAWAAYKAGAYLQDAFPMLTADEREMLLNGGHPDCLDSLRSDDDDN